MKLIKTTTHYNEKIYQALSNIENIKAPQLISVTTKIDSIDAFSFYQAGKTYQGERVYWTSTSQSFTMVGVGSAYTLEADQDRFHSTQQAWKSILADAKVDNPFPIPGTGPVALGGFTFDPHCESTSTWEDFPNSKTIIPMYLLTKSTGEDYLTVNVMIHPNDDVEKLYDFVIEEYQRLLTEVPADHNLPELMDKEEVKPEEWKAMVKKATDEIKHGSLGKVVLARELVATFSNDIYTVAVLKQLVKEQNQSYIFAIESGDSCFVGATPERLVKVENRELLSTCLAGTVPRGKTKEEDVQLGNELLHDDKNLQEHDFVVQMIKGAVESCCEDVKVPSSPVLYPLRNLQHLYTPVKGKLKEGYTILEVVQKLHPTPALGGYPVESSLAFIRENEMFDRGWYASPVGWFDAQDNGEFAVAIRSALLKKDQAILFSGCGVVEDSTPESEYEETAIKFLPMLHALGGAK